MPLPPVLVKHFMDALTWCNRGDAPESFADWLNAGYPQALNDLRKIGTEPGAPWSGMPAADSIMFIAENTPEVWALVSLNRTAPPS